MPEAHLRNPVVGTYSECGPFTKHKKRIRKFMESGDTNYIYKNDLNKACFVLMLHILMVKIRLMELQII